MAKITVKCNGCGIDVQRYPSQCLNTIFCSRACRSKYFRENYNVTFVCDFCGNEKTTRRANYKDEGNHFCSKICKDEWQKTGLQGSNNPFFRRKHLKLTKEKISRAKIGRFRGKEAPNYNSHEVFCTYCGKVTIKIGYLINRSKHLFCSVQCNGKWKSENNLGEDNPKWNPDLTAEERTQRRKYPTYYRFIAGVMKRDSYTCNVCGIQSKWGNGLHAHHLNSYDWDKENRTNIDNGVTLCKECHTAFHKQYGYGKNTREQFIEFKESV